MALVGTLTYPRDLTHHFSSIERAAFIGSLSQPGIIFADTMTWHPTTGGDQSLRVGARRFIACPGSVGLSRDVADQRATFAIFDGETITWHRVDYDVAEHARRLAALPHVAEAARIRRERTRI